MPSYSRCQVSRGPYQGRPGVVEVVALADLLLVDGNSIADISILADAADRFLVIMKDGVLYRNTVP